MRLKRRPRRSRKLLLVGSVVAPSSWAGRFPQRLVSVSSLRLKDALLRLFDPRRIGIGRGRDSHRGPASAGAAGRHAGPPCTLFAKRGSSNLPQLLLAPKTGSPPKAISSTQNRSYLCSAFLFLEEVAILSSRAYLFEQTSRDLVALMEANHSFRGSSFPRPGDKKKSVGRLRLVPSQDDRLSRTHRGSSD